MRSEVLAAASVGLTALVLANAWVQRQQFYPSVVYITKSNPSMAVIYLQVDFMIILFFLSSNKLLLAVPGAGDLNWQVDEEVVLWPVESSRV